MSEYTDMVRTVVSLMLMPMVLLNQWANLGYCHGGSHPQENQSRPHIHLVDGGHHHGHHHHHGDGHHHYDLPDEDEEQAAPFPEQHVCAGHDDDALYLPLGSVTAGVRSRQNDELQFRLAAQVILPSLSMISATAALPSASLLALPPPDEALDSCPLYLQMLTLLI